MRLAQILFSQGFGTRRECDALIRQGRVTIDGCSLADPTTDVPTEGLNFAVDGQPWPFQETALVLLNKAAGYECSRTPRHHPGVLSLLPPPLRRRGVQPVGRLDEDTTGALLLTDDGALIHRLTSPKRHVPKVYEVTCRHAVDGRQVDALLAGVTLHDDPTAVRAAACEMTGPTTLRLTLTEGKYHQVKRMLAAVGNRVEQLHRSAFGSIVVPPELQPGHWRWVEADERRTLLAPPASETHDDPRSPEVPNVSVVNQGDGPASTGRGHAS
jgi:16S rRNA pseudouridine516 synthase